MILSENPKISIITVSYNSAETIEDTIRSVLAQDYSNIQYIIIDGGSVDGTMDIVERYKKDIDILVSEPDKGIYDAMNKGIDNASGDIVGILNSDDLYAHKKVISRVAKKMSENNAKALYADLLYVDRINLNKVKRCWVSGPFSVRSFMRGWMPPHPTFFTLKTCYDHYGKYNLRLKSAADYELMLRFLYKNKIVPAYLPEVIIKMRVGGQSNESITNRLKANQEDKEAWTMNGLKPAWYTLKMKPIRKISQFFKKPKKGA
ncbi:MAG: glycosyltransferase involved in cell wall biosynthesis [Patiriisocius sp.]|jgi:glycosyltransferase involved in cell wall biosynthesis